MTPSSIGLCSTCAFARRVESARGSAFLRCGRHDEDARFAKYPRLPVITCAGFEDARRPRVPSPDSSERDA